MINYMLAYLFVKSMSLANVMIIVTAAICFTYNKRVAGLTLLVVGGFIVSMIEVLMGI